MKMKKFFALLLVIVMAFTLVTACNKSTPAATSGGGDTPAPAAPADNAPAAPAGNAPAAPAGNAPAAPAGNAPAAPADNAPAAPAENKYSSSPVSDPNGDIIDRSFFTKTWDLDPAVLGTFELSLSTQNAPASANGVVLSQWADMIREATNGGVDITVFFSGTIAAAGDILPATLMGLADIGYIPSSNFVSQLPISSLFALPATGLNSGAMAAAVFWDMLDSGKYTDVLNREYEGLKLLMFWTSGAQSVCATTAVRTVEDMKGLKLRTIGGVGVDFATMLGAAPVTIPAADVYDNMSKNILDGYIFDWAGIESYRLYELTNYYSVRCAYTSPTMLCMNIDVWNSLPPEYQEVIEYFSYRDFSIHYGYALDNVNNVARDQYTTPDELVDFSEEEWGKIQAMCAEYNAGRVAELTTSSFDGAQFLSDMLETASKYSDDYAYFLYK